MATYYEGAGIDFIVAFATTAGTAADPTTVTLKVKDPAGTATTYTYALAEVSKTATGAYHKQLTGTLAGTYHWRWVGAGALDAVDEGSCLVAQSQVI